MDTKRYAGVVVKHNDEILLCKRNNKGSFPGMWSIPAGSLEKDEETIDCAAREFFEETNIKIDPKDLKFTGLVPRYTRDGKKIKGLMYVYLLNVDEILEPDFENAKDGEEHTDWKYSKLEDIRSETTGIYLYKLLKIILEKK